MGVRSLRSSISISLAVHALIALICAFLLSQRPAVNTTPPLTWIELEPILKAPKPAVSSAENKLRKQIVQSEPGRLTKTPSKDAFLGEKNQEVDRETVSRDHTTVLGQTASSAKPSRKRERNADAEARERLAGELSGPRPLARLGLPILPLAREKALGPESQGLQPEWATPGVRPQDYVPGLKESERTALNTREFVYYGYYQRIRERLDRAWIPILREKLIRYYSGGRKLASEMDYTTKVMVVLNGSGEIVRLQILGESGTRDLDDAAIRAFNLAGPFPNPPVGIADLNGEIQIPWEFILRT